MNAEDDQIILKGVGKWMIPELEPLDPDIVEGLKDVEWFTFKDAKSHYINGKDKSKCGIHFYLDDKWFNAVWSSPDKYIDYFKEFYAVHSPDFSMYTDWPMAVQIYNHYRKQWIAAWWQKHGINVIPTACWSTKDSFEWCFDGLPKNSVISVSSVGCNKKPEYWENFIIGCREMINQLNPTVILWRGKIPEEFENLNIIKINDQGDLHFKQRHTNSKKKGD